jgi:energy-coupling factor transporter ATP-binding protein EcfA2
VATDSAVARDGSVAVGRDVRGNIYLTYQSAPGRGLLTQQEFEQTLDDYLRWVSRICGTARLYGLKSLPTAKTHKVSTLSDVFVPLSLRRFVPLLRQEIEAAASAEGMDSTQAYLRLVEGKRREGEEIALAALLTIQNRVALIGGAGSGKSTLLRYLAFLLAKAALDNNRRPVVQLPEGKSSLVPMLIPLRNFREYRESCAHAHHQALDDPRSGTLAGFIPWYLQHNGSPLSVSKDFVERLLQGGGCLLMLDGLDEVVSRDMRGQVRQEVEHLVTSLPPGNVVLVTAREAGYRENAVFGDDFVRLDVQPLDEEQIRVLVESWCHLLYPGEEKQRAQELLSAYRED